MAARVLAPSPCTALRSRQTAALRAGKPCVLRTGSLRHTIVMSAAAHHAPTAWSLSSYDDVVEEKYKCEILKQCNLGVSPSTPVEIIMSRELTTTTPRATLAEVEALFAQRPISGMPVLKEGVVVGVISRKDMHQHWNAGNLVQDVMSQPAITVTPANTVMDAAMLMLRYKIHRLPVVDNEKHVIGMVTRTDVFNALGIFKAGP